MITQTWWTGKKHKPESIEKIRQAKLGTLVRNHGDKKKNLYDKADAKDKADIDAILDKYKEPK